METIAKLENFFSTLNFNIKNFNEAKKRLNVYLAKDFNVFVDYICPDENAISDMIADLLNPAGSHGQRSAFLKKFLEFINEKLPEKLFVEFDKCTVTREDRARHIGTTKRKIDITLDFGKIGIGIENKPWDRDQKNQVKDYAENLKKKYADKYIIIYLSGDGNPPSSKSIDEQTRKELEDKDKLLVFSYGDDLKNWLENCYKECKAEKMRWFLHDFIDYIETNFSGQGASMSDQEEKDLIAEYCMKEGNFKIAYNIYNSFEEIREKVIAGFLKDLETGLKGKLDNGWNIFQNITDNSNNICEKWGGFYIAKNIWEEKYCIGFQFDKNLESFYAGICKNQENLPSIKKIYETMENNYRPGKFDDTYDWYYYLEHPYDDWKNEEALTKMLSGEAVINFTEMILTIIKISERIIDKHIENLDK